MDRSGGCGLQTDQLIKIEDRHLRNNSELQRVSYINTSIASHEISMRDRYRQAVSSMASSYANTNSDRNNALLEKI